MSELGGTVGDQAESVLTFLLILNSQVSTLGANGRDGEELLTLTRNPNRTCTIGIYHVAAPRIGLLGIVVFSDAAFLEILCALPQRYYKSQGASGSAPPALV